MAQENGNGHSKGYVIYADSEKCKGCRKCELACIASHNDITIKDAVKMRNELAARVHVIKTDNIKMPVQCHQCEFPPCVNVCPTQALIQQDDTVVMRTQYCAGCGLCVMACPYGAISTSFVRLTEEEKAKLDSGDEPRMVAVRCDLCKEWRAKEGKDVSACVEACPAGALRMIPVEEYRRLMREGTVPMKDINEDFTPVLP